MFAHHDDPDARVLEVKKWLAAKGVANFEPVTLFAEQLEKVRPLGLQSSLSSIFFLEFDLFHLFYPRRKPSSESRSSPTGFTPTETQSTSRRL